MEMPLKELVKRSMKEYFERLDGEQTSDLYNFVLAETEPPLFEAVMNYTDGNQSKAAKLLGISRNTLRKKLEQYNIGSLK